MITPILMSKQLDRLKAFIEDILIIVFGDIDAAKHYDIEQCLSRLRRFSDQSHLLERMSELNVMTDLGIDQCIAIIKIPVVDEAGEQVMDMFACYMATGGTMMEAIENVIEEYDKGNFEHRNCNPFHGIEED